jgi:putative transposase
MLIEPRHEQITVTRQCELLGLPRSSLYYRRHGDDSLNLRLKRLIDEEYMRHPFYGAPRMTDWLNRRGYRVNIKRVRRLMREMGLTAIAPKPRLSAPGANHRVYPYLLRDLAVTRPNQVWAADITYVPMPHGFLYLVAIIDWYSRYVIAWELSNTLTVGKPLAELPPQAVQSITIQVYTACKIFFNSALRHD